MKEQILKALLAHRGSYLSGEHLSRLAGVSRTSIWKHINQLRAEGYAIESIPSKGYQLLVPEDALVREDLLAELEGTGLIHDIITLKTVGSTNTFGRELKETGVLVLAEEQTQGKGRMGRAWSAPSGEGLWFSLVLRPELDPAQASLLTQIAAASVWEGVRTVAGLSAAIKWPNDILVGNRKLCGILTEMNAELGQIERLVVGIGINVHTLRFPEALSDIATSLQQELGRKVSRKQLLVEILKRFEHHYNNLVLHNNYSEVIEICRAQSAVIGRNIRITTGSRTEYALAVDILPTGELLIRRPDGSEGRLLAGEVSVRESVD